jgi:spore germination cell wall hydrolase CwlJ-like protein
MTHKGLRKTEQIMPWKSLLAALPVIMVWQYYDTKQDIAHIEGAQMALERVFVDTQERAMSGVPRGPMPQWEESADKVDLEQLQSAKKISQPPADYRRGLEVIKTRQSVDYVKLDVFCLAKNIFHEAGVEDQLGKYAVAQVTLNRMKNPKYPKTVCEVVMDPFQFSWANDRKIRWTRPKGSSWYESVKIAENVLIKGYRVKGLEKANYYHADYVNPRWKKPEAKIAKVGTHIFYASAR